MTEFQKAIENYSAKEIAAAFPGMPVQTAYGWKNTPRAPAEWMRPLILTHLQNFDPEKSKATPLPPWFIEWLAGVDLVSVDKMEAAVNMMIQGLAEEIPGIVSQVMDNQLEEKVEKPLRYWIKEDALRINSDHTVKDGG